MEVKIVLLILLIRNNNMANVADQNKLTQKQYEHIAAPMELDLMAYFDILETEVFEILDDENITVDDFINQVKDLF
jgi:hypothetical protein